jgi:hypothetical protein
MTDDLPANPSASRWHPWRWVVAVIALLAGGAVVSSFFFPPPSKPPLPGPAPAVADEASAEQVHQFCGAVCHAYPPADTFPRWAWRVEVKQAYEFFLNSKLQIDFPSQESVARYYEKRAPEAFSPLKFDKPPRPYPVSFRKKEFSYPGKPAAPAISNLDLVHLFDDRRLDVLICDMRLGQVLVLQPYTTPPTWRVLYSNGPDKGFNPAHATVVDLDGDGIKDLLVANLGFFGPTDAPCGSVVWLRGLGKGQFQPFTLLDGVGRVADVQAADFRGIGKRDAIVSAFGWRNTGEIIYLENQTTDWSKPRFVPRVLDDRHGTIHVPVADLDGDGKPDFVALISQEHETVVAFLNQGGGKFKKETIWSAPHPGYGSSGIQLVDLNGDGKLDVLFTNGDSLDTPYVLKPYHGVQWLENRGKFPFTHHHLTAMYGTMRAVAADFTGKGRKDIVAIGVLPEHHFPRRSELGLDSVILLEQTAPGKFIRHSLETITCDHYGCAVGDVFADGILHLVIGNFLFPEENRNSPAVTMWQNPGHQRAGAAGNARKLAR